jgi:hypothetical protein
LEVGVYEGHSLAMWDAYFKQSKVIGLDIDVSRVKFDVDARLCDGTNRESVQTVIGDTVFDYIIDDGSHRVVDQIQSFNILWERVKPGGKYFIEDIAGDEELSRIRDAITEAGASFFVYDLRAEKGRFDDILVVVLK